MSRALADTTDGLPLPQRYWAILTIALGVVMSVMDGAIANVALPTIAQDLHASPAFSIWVVNGYQLAITISLLPLASLGDIIGYRRVYLAGLLLFTLASLLCALSNTLVLLALALSPASFAALGLSAKPLIDLIFKPQMTIAERSASTCQTVSDVASMTQLPKGRVMAPIDLGPAILADTDHVIFAAPYHRNNDGNVAMLRLMLAPVPTARQILSDRRVDYVVTCPGVAEQDFVKLAPDGLAARLGRGETPGFLEPLDIDPTHKISVWRVRR